MAVYSEQASLLQAATAGDCFQADELPDVPEEMRKAPRARGVKGSCLGEVVGVGKRQGRERGFIHK